MRRDLYVLHVKPRTEKKTLAYLEKYGFYRYLPLYVKVTKVQRRKVRRTLPIFPGYVFSALLPEERTRMLMTNLVVATIRVPRPRELVHQLRQVGRASRKSASELKCLSQTYRSGDFVRVKSGPLRGTEGYVKYDGGRAKLCLNVSILGAAVEVTVSPEDVEKIEKKAEE